MRSDPSLADFTFGRRKKCEQKLAPACASVFLEQAPIVINTRGELSGKTNVKREVFYLANAAEARTTERDTNR